jgi:excisionase family DNA binding protein
MTAQTQLLYTEVQASEVLSLSRSTLRRLWKEERLVPLKIGRSIRYRSSDLFEFANSLATAPA